ncbi:hypothetical protein [Methylovulum sp.]|uniref:hypothetical protein n=1 Tax=Methylovulum sp. TaxID=1916980 RepID=UPI00260650D2|nr:hypothetical protein [Methylovulum sp.]MDD5125030.1 hypothetical protein [Methylovulum sp.]
MGNLKIWGQPVNNQASKSRNAKADTNSLLIANTPRQTTRTAKTKPSLQAKAARTKATRPKTQQKPQPEQDANPKEQTATKAGGKHHLKKPDLATKLFEQPEAGKTQKPPNLRAQRK